MPARSKYSLYSLIRLNFDLITGFSVVPLQLFSMVGMAVSVLSALLVVYLFVRRLIVGPGSGRIVHAVRHGVLLHRSRLVRHRPAGRIRRAHLRSGARAAALHRRGRARGGRDEENAARGTAARRLPRRQASVTGAVGSDPCGGVRLQRGRGALRARALGAGHRDPAPLHACG